MRLRGEVLAFVLILFSVVSVASWSFQTQPRHANISMAYLSSPSEIIYNGTLYVNGSQIYQIHNCQLNLTGTIFVQDNSTLDIENSTLTVTYHSPSVENPHLDFLFGLNESHVFINNSTIIIQAEDWGAMYARDNAEIQVMNCSFLGSRSSWLEADNPQGSILKIQRYPFMIVGCTPLDLPLYR